VLRALSAKYAPRASSGKLLTLYPVDEGQLHVTLTELDAALDGEAGPYLLSDLRWERGPLYVRYGGFVRRTRLAPDGRTEAVITDPSGADVSDRRQPVFAVPDWVRPPPFLRELIERRGRTDALDLPYRFTKALHFSNAGGVYGATRVADGEPVVVKEARPYAGIDVMSCDAIARLRREHRALQRLAGIPGVPRLLDYRTAGEHEFLA
jgi:hypothetical protein